MATAEWTDDRLSDAFEALRADLRAMREDMADMRSEMRGIRADLHADINHLRSDMNAEFREVRIERRVLWPAIVGAYGAVLATVIGTHI
jgi:hypothetical protein